MSSIRSVLVVLGLGVLGGCSSVSVIGPVATQAERNATALDENLQGLLSDTDLLMRASVDMLYIDIQTDLLLAILDSRPAGASPTAVATWFADQAKLLVSEVDGKDSQEAKDAIRNEYRATKPLVAAVAFDALSAEQAASKWEALEQIHQIPVDSGADKFQLNAQLIRDLRIVQEATEARQSILDGYGRLREAILTQSSNGRLLAGELVRASQSGADAGRFLQGVTENAEVLRTIGGAVARFSDNPKRVAAAETFLEGLKEPEKIVDANP